MQSWTRFLCALWLLAACLPGATLLAQPSPTPGAYVIDSDASLLRIMVFRGGIAGRFGHNHVVSHRNVRGCLRVAEPLADSQASLQFDLADLEVDREDDRRAAGNAFPVPVPEKDIRGTRDNMLGDDLLRAATHPHAAVTLLGIEPQGDLLKLALAVELAGTRSEIDFPVALETAADGMLLRGTRRITHAQLGLEPFSAAFGALRVADEMRFEVAIGARPASAGDASDCEGALAVVDDDRVALADAAAE